MPSSSSSSSSNDAPAASSSASSPGGGTAASHKKGLPGFLRRSLRPASMTYEEEEEEEEERREDGKRDDDDDGRVVDDDDDESDGASGSDDEEEEAAGGAASGRGRRDDGGVGGGKEPKKKAATLPDDDGATPPPPSDVGREGEGEVEGERRETGGGREGGGGTTTYENSGGGGGGGRSGNKKSYRELQFEKVINAPVVNVRELRKLGWNGIPPEHRAKSWMILLGYLPANSSRRSSTLLRKRSEYRESVLRHYSGVSDDSRTSQEQETLRQVLVDVPRTAPDVGLFRDGRVRKCLTRILYVWACRHPASSYVQGINDLATPLISTFLSGRHGGGDVLDGGPILENTSDVILEEIEADVYWCLTNLLSGIQDHYTSDQPGVQRMVLRLEELVNRIDSDLTNHFRNVGVEFFQFAFKWMNCLLLREFDLRKAVRLWDSYLSDEGSADGNNVGFEDFHVYVCAAFLCRYSAEVREMEFDELFGFLQNMPTADWTDADVEVLLSQAFVLSTLFGGSDAHLASGGGIPR